MKCSICKSKLSGEPMKLVGRNRPLTVCDECVSRLNVKLGFNLTKVNKERKTVDESK